MKSWVSSAFAENTTCTNSKSASVKKELPATRSLKTTKSSFDSSVPAFKNAEKPPHIASVISRKQFVSLVDKYKPKTRADLIVNKTKTEQLSQLLDGVINKCKGSVVIIEGPSGCGKLVITMNIYISICPHAE